MDPHCCYEIATPQKAYSITTVFFFIIPIIFLVSVLIFTPKPGPIFWGPSYLPSYLLILFTFVIFL